VPRNIGLTRIAVGGTAWLLGSSLVTQLLSLLAQVVLGWLLSESDFGLYALAIGVTACLQVFRDGGVSLWLARQNRDEFAGHVIQGFWLCLLSSVGVAISMALVAPLAGSIYREPKICQLILIVAASVPLESYNVVAEANLQVSLRFRALALFRTVGALARYGLTIWMAHTGWGPSSFVLPLIPLAIFRTFVAFALTGLAPWRERMSWQHIRTSFRASKWVFGGTFASSIFRQIDYLVLGLVAPTTVVGVYFFAYQLAVQPVLLFSQSLRQVLIPTFSLAGDDAARQLRAIVRAAAFIGLINSGLFLLFALLAGTLEHLLWQGRWLSAVPAMRWLAAAMPLHLFALLIRMVVQSAGRFRLWGAAVVVRSLGLAVTVALLAISWNRDPSSIAAGVALYLAVSSLLEAAFLMRYLNIPWQPVFHVVVPPYLFTVFVAILCGYFAQQLTTISPMLRAMLVAVTFVAVVSVGCVVLFRGSVRHISSLGNARS
jgi:PST family polysaccharide transporter